MSEQPTSGASQPPSRTIWNELVDEHRRVVTDAQSALEADFEQICQLCESALAAGHKLLVCGNGGSAADAQHFVAELVCRFEAERAGLPAIALTTDPSITTAVSNDYGFERLFARQVEALGRPGDVLIAISTSGNSPNCLAAAESAQKRGMPIVALCGLSGGTLAPIADASICVPSTRTARIQEVHIIVLHALAQALESWATTHLG